MNKKSITLNLLQSQCRDAALGELPWETLLENICHWVGGDRAMMLSAHHGKPYTATVSYNHDISNVKAYNKEFNGDDPRTSFSKLTRPGQTRTGQQYVENSDIAQTDYFNIISKRADQLDSLHSVILDSSSSGRQAISIHRSFSNELFGLDDVDRMQTLLPHLIDAYQYAIRISGKLSQALASQDCAFLIRPDMQTLLLSGDPQSVILGNSAFSWNGKHLRVKSTTFKKFLDLAIVRGAQGHSSKCRIQVMQSHISEDNPYIQIVMSPKPELVDWMSDMDESVVLYIVRLQTEMNVKNCEIFSEIFQLTKSESLTLKNLYQTRNLRDTANLADLSYETARWHLKNIFSKTGYKNQEELTTAITRMDLSNAL